MSRKKVPQNPETAPTTSLSPITTPDTSIENLITRAIDKGVPVETMERLLAMRRELQAEFAKKAYDKAMAAFQAECPTIVKTKEVHTRDGRLAYKYAPIESIVQQVQPYLIKYGFSYSTTMELKENGVRVVCKVTHEQGHSEESPMEVPFGTQTQIMSQSQVAAAASTFAKRYAFCNAFGILTGDEDTDASPEPKMQPYKVERKYPDMPVENDEPDVVQTEPPSGIVQKKQMIVRRLLELDPLTDVKNAKMIALEVASRTKLELKEENFDEIIARLAVLVDEKREAASAPKDVEPIEY